MHMVQKPQAVKDMNKPDTNLKTSYKSNWSTDIHKLNRAGCEWLGALMHIEFGLSRRASEKL